MEAAGFTEAASLPLDDKCRHGRLANGLTYYIQSNKKPEARAELRLVVNIGSVYEDDDEQGLAHMVEHLAFRGRAAFSGTVEVVGRVVGGVQEVVQEEGEGGGLLSSSCLLVCCALTMDIRFLGTQLYDTFEVVKYLESIGAKFGACQNAYTSFDETVYEQVRCRQAGCAALFATAPEVNACLKAGVPPQHIPIDKEGLLEKSLTVLKEWAFYVRCSDEDVEAERSVVYEEWRQRRSAAGRSDEDYFKTLMGGSKVTYYGTHAWSHACSHVCSCVDLICCMCYCAVRVASADRQARRHTARQPSHRTRVLSKVVSSKAHGDPGSR